MAERTEPPVPCEGGDSREPLCGGEAAVHLLLPATPASVPYARSRLLADLRQWGVAEPERHVVLVAVGEAVTNAVVHAACPEGGAPLVIRWALRGEVLCVSVQDRGEGFEPSSSSLEESRLSTSGRGQTTASNRHTSHSTHPSHRRDADSGRGLLLMHVLMDQVLIESTTRGTRVLMEKRLSSISGASDTSLQ